MPNWVINNLIVSGPKEKLEEFKRLVSDGDELLEANRIIPYPEIFAVLDKLHPFSLIKDKPIIPTEQDSQLLKEAALGGYDTQRDGYNQGGYEWCVVNWGTKWGFCESRIVSEDNNQIAYQFDTAWSPPRPLITKMGEMFPEIEFKLGYYEGGMGFQGHLRIKNGEVVEDWSGDYNGNQGG